MPLLTNKFAKIAAAADKVFFDSTEGSPKGFGLRVTRNGAKTWVFGYRVKGTGRQRRMVIGDVGAWPVGEARKRAAELRRGLGSRPSRASAKFGIATPLRRCPIWRPRRRASIAQCGAIILRPCSARKR